jgi:hypothetical protein
MSRRAIVLFWGATAASVLFLGSAWAAAGGRSGADVVVFAVSLVGLAATLFVAGRISFVVARAQRAAARRRSR